MKLRNFISKINGRLICSICNENDIDHALVLAFVLKESMGKSSASRYEKNYRWLYKPEHYAEINNITFVTEVMHQKTSWGLMQIMGATAREVGFEGDLPELIFEDVGLRYAILYLKKLMQSYNEQDAISAYNQGSPRKEKIGLKKRYANQAYVNDILNYKKMFI